MFSPRSPVVVVAGKIQPASSRTLKKKSLAKGEFFFLLRVSFVALVLLRFLYLRRKFILFPIFNFSMFFLQKKEYKKTMYIYIAHQEYIKFFRSFLSFLELLFFAFNFSVGKRFFFPTTVSEKFFALRNKLVFTIHVVVWHFLS